MRLDLKEQRRTCIKITYNFQSRCRDACVSMSKYMRYMLQFTHVVTNPIAVRQLRLPNSLKKIKPVNVLK